MRRPVSAGTILVEEFLQPLGLTQTQLAERSGLPRKHVNELCRDRRAVTADTALILGRVFGNSADFWLNTQRRMDLWEALNTPSRADRIARALPFQPNAGRTKVA
jgi:addiction module HigA family antidote